MKPNIKGVEWHRTCSFQTYTWYTNYIPGYLEHEYAVDYGYEPFRFIHWNIQAVPKEMAKDV